jgi:ABC-2 type transport system permease protein
MIWKIMRHEWRQLIYDRTGLIVAAFLAGVSLYAIVSTASYTEAQRAALTQYKSLETARLAALRQQDAETVAQVDAGKLKIPPGTNSPRFTPLFPLWASYESQRDAMFELTPLAFLSVGQVDIQTPGLRALWPGRYLYQSEPIANQTRSPLKMAVGNPDMTFVVVYLVPLLILTMGYNLIAGERDAGTLSLLFAQPVRPRTVIAAKVLLRAAVFLVAFLLPLSIGVWIARVDLSLHETKIAFVAWIFAALLYAFVWLSLTIAVNAFGWSAAKNALLLSLCWLLFVVLVPSLSAFVCSLLYPLPSPIAEINAKRGAMMTTRIYAIAQNTKELAQPDSQANRYIELFCKNHLDLGCSSSSELERKETLLAAAPMEEVNRLTKPIDEELTEQWRRQERLMGVLRFFSPASLIESVLTDLAGTGAERYGRFREQALAAQKQWRYYFVVKNFRRELLRPEDYDRFSYFHFQEEALGSRLGRASFICFGIATQAFAWLLLCALRWKKFLITG